MYQLLINTLSPTSSYELMCFVSNVDSYQGMVDSILTEDEIMSYQVEEEAAASAKKQSINRRNYITPRDNRSTIAVDMSNGLKSRMTGRIPASVDSPIKNPDLPRGLDQLPVVPPPPIGLSVPLASTPPTATVNPESLLSTMSMEATKEIPWRKKMCNVGESRYGCLNFELELEFLKAIVSMDAAKITECVAKYVHTKASVSTE
jgi:hypothetical protein